MGTEELRCSFCAKTQKQVRKLISGPNVYICDECVYLCLEIIDQDAGAPPSETQDRQSRSITVTTHTIRGVTAKPKPAPSEPTKE